MKLVMKKFFFLLPAFALAIAVSACREEPLPNGGEDNKPGNKVTVILGGDVIATKAAAHAETIRPIDLSKETGIDGLVLTETVSTLDEAYYPEETKGTPVYTENFDTMFGDDLRFSVFAPTGTSDLLDDYFYGLNAATFDKESERVYSHVYQNGIRWPEVDGKGQLLYFLQAPGAETTKLAPEFYGDGHIEFDYTCPSLTDPTAQTDILFTSKLMEEATKDTKNHILMYHALTAVKFKANLINFRTSDEREDKAVVTIDKVVMYDLYSKGHCTIRPNYIDGVNTSDGNTSNKKKDDGSNSATKSSACSTWSSLDVKANYEFSYTGGLVSPTYEEGTSPFAASFYDGETATANINDADFKHTMMIIPQATETGKTIRFDITFSIKSSEGTKTYTKTANLAINWKAGEIHTYQLTINCVDVKVEDTVTATKKSDVATYNTGTAIAYLRAAFASAWYYGGIAVSPYLPSQGSYTGLPGADWIEGADGYFYYKHPVLPGNATDSPLFTEFNLASGVVNPFPGSHFETKIVLQGVIFDENKTKVGQAWGKLVDKDGNNIVDQLATSPEKLETSPEK